MATGNHSLVKYNNPIHITAQGKSKSESKNKLTATEDILNSILPPREWTEGGKLWVQYVSSSPSTKKDVLMLQKALDTKLQQKQARETGICPVREELYSQAFDELIRQVTIMCAERGLLLLRVREELRMAITAYQTLYESSTAYGMRRSLTQDFNRREAEDRMEQLEKENTLLEIKIEEEQDKTAKMLKRAADEHMIATDRHAEDVKLIQDHNVKLRASLAEKLSVKEKVEKKDDKKGTKKEGEEAEEEKTEEGKEKVEAEKKAE